MADTVEEPPGLPSTDDVAGRTVADVMHDGIEPLPSTATVAEVRAWFAQSASRRLVVLADADGRYRGALVRDDVPPDGAGDRPALDLAPAHPTLAPDAPAATGRDLVVALPARRAPVVDAEGTFAGVLAVTRDLQHFACRLPARD